MRTIIPANRLLYPLYLTEYGDFNSPHCREVQSLLATTLPQFGDDIFHTYRHFPESGNPSALLMALAAEAARRQKQYWAMHRALFTHPPLTAASLDSVSALAGSIGLDRTTFLLDMNDATLKQRIRTDVEQGRRAGVVTTPTLFLGRHRLHGKLTQARLAPLIRYYVHRFQASMSNMADANQGLVRWSGVGHHESA